MEESPQINALNLNEYHDLMMFLDAGLLVKGQEWSGVKLSFRVTRKGLLGIRALLNTHAIEPGPEWEKLAEANPELLSDMPPPTTKWD